MNEIFFKIIIVFGIFVIVSIIMDLKAKNFISENHNMIWYATMYSSAHIVFTFENNYDSPLFNKRACFNKGVFA